jgi:hypothetical protein
MMDSIAEALGVSEFALGVLVGIGIAFVAFVLRWWWGGVTAPLQPQRITHTTRQTPAGVLLNSCLMLLVGLVVVVVLLSLVTGRAVLPRVLEMLWD